MPSPHRSTLLRMLALAGMAAVAALVSNTLASPARRLAWSGSGLARPMPAPLREEAAVPVPSNPLATHPSRPIAPIHPAPLAMPQAPVVPPPQPQQLSAANPIREINSEEAWKAFQTGVPFLDARRSAEYAEGHISGAWCTPIWESDLDDRLLSFKAVRRPGPDDPIIIYCSGGSCRDSHLLAAKLLDEGYFHLLIYRDGYPDWVAQGRMIETGQP